MKTLKVIYTTVVAMGLTIGFSQASANQLDSESATVTLAVGKFAKLSLLNDFALSLKTGQDGDAGDVYDGQDEFRVESNCAVIITVEGNDLSNGSGSSISTVYKLDDADSIQTAPGVHNAVHSVSAEATLGNISEQEAGDYAADITITVSAI